MKVTQGVEETDRKQIVELESQLKFESELRYFSPFVDFFSQKKFSTPPLLLLLLLLLEMSLFFLLWIPPPLYGLLLN